MPTLTQPGAHADFSRKHVLCRGLCPRSRACFGAGRLAPGRTPEPSLSRLPTGSYLVGRAGLSGCLFRDECRIKCAQTTGWRYRRVIAARSATRFVEAAAEGHLTRSTLSERALERFAIKSSIVSNIRIVAGAIARPRPQARSNAMSKALMASLSFIEKTKRG
jgi:hypothetical protein